MMRATPHVRPTRPTAILDPRRASGTVAGDLLDKNARELALFRFRSSVREGPGSSALPVGRPSRVGTRRDRETRSPALSGEISDRPDPRLVPGSDRSRRARGRNDGPIGSGIPPRLPRGRETFAGPSGSFLAGRSARAKSLQLAETKLRMTTAHKPPTFARCDSCLYLDGRKGRSPNCACTISGIVPIIPSRQISKRASLGLDAWSPIKGGEPYRVKSVGDGDAKARRCRAYAPGISSEFVAIRRRIRFLSASTDAASSHGVQAPAFPALFSCSEAGY